MKLSILSTTILSTLSVFTHATDTKDKPAKEVEVIEIKGTRLQNLESIQVKKTSVNMVDSLSQDEMGRQPDFNIGDALKRAPGIATIPDEDEGQFVSIRGINADLTLVTLDGGQVATGNEGDSRRVSMEFFPAAVIKRLDVIKNRTPDIDGNAIGGQVNLITRSAYDSLGEYGVFTGVVGQFDQDNAPFAIDDKSGNNGISLRGSAVYSNLFGDDNQFGFVLAASYLDKDRDEERIIPISFAGEPGVAGQPVAPNLTIYSTYHNPVERVGLLGKFEYKPSDEFYMSFQGHHFSQDDFARRESELIIGGTPSFTTATSGTVENAIRLFGADQFNAENLQAGLQFNLEYEFSESKEFDIKLSHSIGEFYQSSPNIDFNPTTTTYDYTYEGGVPIIVHRNADSLNDLSKYSLKNISPFTQDYDNTVSEFAVNFRDNYNLFGWGYQIGTRYREVEQEYNHAQTANIYKGSTATLQDFAENSNYVPPYAHIPTQFVNFGKVSSFLAQNPESFDTSDTSQGMLYRVNEKVSAAYLAVSYGGDNYGIIFGGRYEKTDVDSFSKTEKQEGDYNNFLPSIMATYDFDNLEGNFEDNELILRASYSKAVGRANIGDLRIATIADPAASILTISGGDPSLKPRISDNYDIALDYYFADDKNMLSAAIFFKDISDDIFRVTRNIVINGQPAVSSQPVNTSSSMIKGLELSLVLDSMEFLPESFRGLGFSANATFIDGKSDLVNSDGSIETVDFVFEQPETVVNAAIYYQYENIEAKVSYNFSGEFHRGFAGDINNTDVQDAYDTTDFHLSYSPQEKLSLMFEIRNLANEDLVRRTGANQQFINDISKFGRSFWLGATYKL